MTAPSLECLRRMAEVLEIDLDPQETNVVDLDDHRHGTLAGYVARCRCTPCTDAVTRYEKRRKLDQLAGRRRTIPVGGARRRVQALNRLGWSSQAMSLDLGRSKDWLYVTVSPRSDMIYARNHALIVDLFESRCMTTGPSEETRRRATAKGWPPPLAWADIDAGVLAVAEKSSRLTWFDEIRVERIVDGDQTLAAEATRPERLEVIRRWRALGRSDKALERLTGWQHLYRDADQGAAA